MRHDTGLTLYISSTYTDLAAERAVVVEAATNAGFGVLQTYRAADASVGESVATDVTKADAIVLVVAFRYGYRLPNGLSVTETEYEAALSAGMPILVFALDETAPWPVSSIATGPELDDVKRFRENLSKRHVVSYFTSAADLKALSVTALFRLAEHVPRSPDHHEAPAEGTTSHDPGIASALLEIRSQLAFLTTRALERHDGLAAPVAQPIRSAAFLGPAAPQVDSLKVFVIMPYSMPWSEAVERLLSEACKSAGFDPEVAKYSDGRMIIHDIWRGITASAAVVADLTGGNPNVAYEVGLADAIGREAILITQTADVPVDFRGARLLVYENSINGSHRLREELQNRLVALRERIKDSGVRK